MGTRYSDMTPEEKRIFDERIRKAKEERLSKPKPKRKPKPPEEVKEKNFVKGGRRAVGLKDGGVVKSPCGFDKIKKMFKKKK